MYYKRRIHYGSVKVLWTNTSWIIQRPKCASISFSAHLITTYTVCRLHMGASNNAPRTELFIFTRVSLTHRHVSLNFQSVKDFFPSLFYFPFRNFGHKNSRVLLSHATYDFIVEIVKGGNVKKVLLFFFRNYWIMQWSEKLAWIYFYFKMKTWWLECIYIYIYIREKKRQVTGETKSFRKIWRKKTST